jgi:ABC-2 type transport system permease protein
VRETLAVFRKEMRAYLVSPIPYLLAAVVSVFVAYFVLESRYFLILRTARLDSLFEGLPLVLAVVVPAVSMRLWSEEFRQRTFEALLTYPVRTRHLVLGKWLAAWGVIGGCILATVGIPITAAWLGDIDTGPLIGGYLGAWLMGGAFLAIGMWLSALTRNQIVAFILGVLVCGVLVVIEGAAARLEGGAAASAMSAVSATAHFGAIGRGVVDVRDLAYFASLIGFFLYLNSETVENRRSR